MKEKEGENSMYKGGNREGVSPVTVGLGNGDWVVTFLDGSGTICSETWNADEPDVGPALLADVSPIYIDNHGDIVDVIPAHRLVRVQREDAIP